MQCFIYHLAGTSSMYFRLFCNFFFMLITIIFNFYKPRFPISIIKFLTVFFSLLPICRIIFICIPKYLPFLPQLLSMLLPIFRSLL